MNMSLKIFSPLLLVVEAHSLAQHFSEPSQKLLRLAADVPGT